MKLTVNVRYTADNKGWIMAEVPELLKCVSWGRTMAEARENIEHAIRVWLAATNSRGQVFEPMTVEWDEQHQGESRTNDE